MDRSMLKLYLFMALGLCAAALYLPNILVRTSAFLSDTSTRATLYANRFQKADATGAVENDKANVIFIMDDGYETQFTRGYPILKQNGYQACVSVIPAAVGTPGYMDYRQLAELYINGWDLLNHTYNHADLMNLPPAEQADQLNRTRDWLKNHLMDRGSNIVVYPGSEPSDALTHLLQIQGYVAARSQRSLWIASEHGAPEDVEICSITGETPFSNVTDALGRAIRNKGTLILVLHRIEPVCEDAGMQVETWFFTNIVDYLRAHSGELDVVTLTKYLSDRSARHAALERIIIADEDCAPRAANGTMADTLSFALLPKAKAVIGQ